MRWIKRVAGMQRLARRWRAGSVPVGLVPTMGYLHEGHSSLIRRARSLVGPDGIVVVSIYVNPTQFGLGEDLSQYPRNLARDRALCRAAGVDVVFAPSDAEMYGGSSVAPLSTYVVEEDLSCVMEGEWRPTHFRGVTTVVAKLFQLVLPDWAVFGAKDIQQAAVVRRMVRDLHFPLRITVVPTVREKDGLALSSRNAYLSSEERRQAVVVVEAIRWVRRKVRERAGARGLPVRQMQQGVNRLLEKRSLVKLDYVAFFDSRTLEPVLRVCRGTHMALAAWVGRTRLIDNGRL